MRAAQHFDARNIDQADVGTTVTGFGVERRFIEINPDLGKTAKRRNAAKLDALGTRSKLRDREAGDGILKVGDRLRVALLDFLLALDADRNRDLEGRLEALLRRDDDFAALDAVNLGRRSRPHRSGRILLRRTCGRSLSAQFHDGIGTLPGAERRQARARQQLAQGVFNRHAPMDAVGLLALRILARRQHLNAGLAAESLDAGACRLRRDIERLRLRDSRRRKVHPDEKRRSQIDPVLRNHAESPQQAP
ncbi:MAG TPA: hypothetical protein VJL90_04800 [Pseudorhodoplanes sp.]|nr:hypothetical protein [Pseudorhodoplanes sp.]